MRVVIAGAHGKIGLRLGRLLAARGDEVFGIVRNPDHRADLVAIDVNPVVLDLEHATVQAVAEVLTATDAAVFSAGAGPGSGAARKDSVDRAAAVLLAEAAERARVRRHLLVSSMGVEKVRGEESPSGMDGVFVAYLRAKLAAEEDLRRRDLDWTILRPGGLTDDPGTGRVRLAPRVDPGKISRDDVAEVLAALLDEPATAGVVLELVAGDTPLRDAVAAATK